MAFPRKLTAVVIVVKMQIQKGQILLKNTLSKLSTTPLLSKNRNRDTLVFIRKQNSDNGIKPLQQNQINTTQKQTKKDKSTHKLHSLHSVT